MRRTLGRCLDAFARRLAGDRRGNVAVMFALSLVPCAFVAGSAVDYAGAANLKARLQSATDGTNLQLCKMSTAATQAQLQTAATTAMGGYMAGRSYAVDSVVVSSNPRQIQLNTKATFSTAIVGIMSSSFRTLTVRASAACSGEPATFEIALVLDNTGSMAASSGGVSKMQALQNASTSFVNSIFNDPRLGPNTKMSLVPFAAAVAVSPSASRTASWVDTGGLSGTHWTILQNGKTAATAALMTSRFDLFTKLKASVAAWDWTGCFESLPYPLNVQDGAPSVANPNGYYVPMLAPDESGDGGEVYHRDASRNTVLSINSYMDDENVLSTCGAATDEATRNGRACKYQKITNPKTSNGYLDTGPNAFCTTRPLTRLTTSTSTLLNEISLMDPGGATNIHEGVMWGWRTLSPSSVFADGRAYGTANNNKVLVLMTDGTNTWNPSSSQVLKSYYSAYGYFKNPDGSTAAGRLPTGTGVPTDADSSRDAIDALTLAACANARAAGITIYTIGFSVPNDPIDSQGIAMLATCAGNASQAFVANDSGSIVTVFQQIAANLGGLRLMR